MNPRISMTTTPISPAAIAKLVDHTLLKPDATPAEVEALIVEADALGTYSICVSPSMLPLSLPAGSQLKVAVVAGFPSGKHTSAVKSAEAAEAVAAGADEVDMVIDIGAAKAHDYESIRADIAAVRSAIPTPTILKVIIESAALTDEEIVGVCQAAVSANADFVKTSTGYHPAGGATEHAVRLMALTVDGKLGVKASGGVRTLDDARRLIAAGATRLGVSGTRAMIEATDGGANAY
jgi:deoxyribose-phosphate aldolase